MASSYLLLLSVLSRRSVLSSRTGHRISLSAAATWASSLVVGGWGHVACSYLDSPYLALSWLRGYDPVGSDLRRITVACCKVSPSTRVCTVGLGRTHIWARACLCIPCPLSFGRSGCKPFHILENSAPAGARRFFFFCISFSFFFFLLVQYSFSIGYLVL